MATTEELTLYESMLLSKTTIGRRNVKTYAGKKKPQWMKHEEIKTKLLNDPQKLSDLQCNISADTTFPKKQSEEQSQEKYLQWEDNTALVMETFKLREEFINNQRYKKRSSRKPTKPWWEDEEVADLCHSMGIFSCPVCGEFYDSIGKHWEQSPACNRDVFSTETYYIPEPVQKKSKKILDPIPDDWKLKFEDINKTYYCLCGAHIRETQEYCTCCINKYHSNKTPEKGYLLEATKNDLYL